jgi:hypothetical protein
MAGDGLPAGSGGAGDFETAQPKANPTISMAVMTAITTILPGIIFNTQRVFSLVV